MHSRGREKQVVQIDLRYGIVKGFSEFITFLSPPIPSKRRGKCEGQSVMKIDFSGPYRTAKFRLNYETPRLWTLDISDSPSGDGFGGDNGTTSNMAETQIFNKQMRIYGNSLPGYLDASINGGLLLKVVDKAVTKDGTVFLEISDERIEWMIGGVKQFIESKFLYTLNGQNVTYGEKDHNVYVGLNRVVAGSFRSGSGLCNATITLLRKEGECPCHISTIQFM